MTSSAGGETKGEFLWDVWVGGGDFKVLLLKPEFMISPLVWILALLRLKIPMTFLFKRGSVVVGVERKKRKTIDSARRIVMMVLCTDWLQMQVGCLKGAFGRFGRSLAFPFHA